MKSNVYLKSVIDSVPRLLCLIDRNPASETYGCCDRTYWHYRIVDFPSARSQEAALTLALIYSSDFEGNSYYRKAQLLEWCRAVMAYWARIQQPNGSFDEWYPMESSFVATAFSSYAVSEALLALRGFDFPGREEVVASLRKAASWLVKRNEVRVSNQLSGCAMALYNIGLLTGDSAFKASADAKVSLILRSQRAEGWWKEYTGPDIGYLSLMASYLVKYYLKSGRRDVLPAVERAMGFLSYFIHPDLGVGGVYGCRNTAYFIPYSAEALASRNRDAASISVHLRRSLYARVAVGPLSLDDRYLSYTCYEWLQAGLAFRSLRDVKPRFASSFARNFPDGRLYVVSTADFYLVINYAKGGAFLLAAKKGGVSFSDSGAVVVSGKKRFGSGFVNERHTAKIMENSVIVSGSFCRVSSHLPTFPKMAALRLFQLLLGRHAWIGLFVKRVLRDILITEARPSDLAYVREFAISGSRIQVTDRVDDVGRLGAKYGDLALKVGIPANFIYVPSTNYFGPGLLSSAEISARISPGKDAITRIYSADGTVKVA